MKIVKCSMCKEYVPSTMIGLDGRCDTCMKKSGWR